MSGSVVDETLSSLKGAWLLFRQNEDGYRLFNVSVTGFWRSFGVFFIILPIYLFSLYVEGRMMEVVRPEMAAEADAGPGMLVIAALGLEWIAFPVLMVFLARLMKLGAFYVPYIIAYNWSAAIISMMLIPALVLFLFGLLGPSAAMGINFGVSFFMLYYRWFIARTSLKVSGSTAAALVAIDFLLSMVIGVAATNMSQG